MQKNRQQTQTAANAGPAAAGAATVGSRMKNLRDIRFEPLYDTYDFSSGAVLAAGLVNRFFSTPLSGAKDYTKTNMSNAGVLPSPQMFRVQGISFEAYINDSTAADLSFLGKLLKYSSINFVVGVKSYLEIPLAEVAGQIHGMVSGGKTDGTAKVGIYQLGSPSPSGYKFPKNAFIDILATENFYVEWTITSGAAVILGSAVSVRCYLDGVRAVEVR